MSTRITFDVPSDFHKMIKTYATLYDQSLKDYIIEKLKQGVSHDAQDLKSSIPNNTTLKALQETMNGDVETFDTTDNLFIALDKIEKDAKNSNH